MKALLTLLIVFLGITNLHSQNITIDTAGIAKLNAQYQVPPKFPGDINKWIANNINSNGQAEGEAVVTFVIQTDGRITDIKLMRVDPMMNNGIGAAAEKILNAMPKWKPAMEDGKPVMANYTLGFLFGN
jgi:Gram-negative bacterial TonB protein C-terminal